MQAERYEAIKRADGRKLFGLVCWLCEDYLRDYPEHGPAYLIFAQNLIPLGRYEEAEVALQKAEEVSPAKWHHLVMAERGHLMKARGAFAAAEKLYLEAHRTDPEDATYLIYAAGVVARQGDLERAVQLSTQATKCEDGCIDEAYYNLGGQLLGLKRYEDALFAYKKALEIDPECRQTRLRIEDVEGILRAAEADK